MLVAVDVAYSQETACAAAVCFLDWSDEKTVAEESVLLDIPESYIPGQFYLRELPCIEKVIGLLSQTPEVVLIDGYVWLGRASRPGLGARLYESLGQTAAVVGVAKNPLQSSTHVERVFRGQSQKPLYVTSAGMDPREAAENVLLMAGEHRIPLLLKQVDQLARGAFQRG